jgi:hypothetical protein
VHFTSDVQQGAIRIFGRLPNGERSAEGDIPPEAVALWTTSAEVRRSVSLVLPSEPATKAGVSG